MRCITKTIVGMFGICAANGACADDLFSMSLEELGEVSVSIATGAPRPLAQAPAVASVVTAEEIALMGAQTLDEVLETIPGLHVSRGSFQYAPRYFIRGVVSTYNPQTLMLVNGLPMTSLFLGDRGERIPNQHSMPVKMIERVEVIRGPGSALYGADAFAGVINVITKSGDDIESTRVSGSWGSFDTGRASLQSGQQWGEISTALSMSYTTSKGDDDAVIDSDLQSIIDQLLPTPASNAPGAASTPLRYYDLRTDMRLDQWQLRLSFMDADDTGTGQGINDALDPDSRFGHRRASSELLWHSDLDNGWALNADISYLYGEFSNDTGILLFPEGAFGVFPDGVIGKPGVKEEHVRVNSSAAWSGWDRHRITLGAGYHWGDMFETTDVNNYINIASPFGVVVTPRPGLTDISDTSDMFVPEAYRYSHYVFFQDEWQFAERWELTSGVRYDVYSDVGTAVNPRLALVWATSDTLTTKLLYGEAFRAPAFFELYGGNNPVAQGNPDLDPERLRSGELAFDWRVNGDWAVALNFYHWFIRDYIDFVSDAGQSTFTAQNVGRIRGYGSEFEVRQRLAPTLNWLANYSYQHTRDEATDEPLGLAPTHQLYARVSWEFRDGWLLTPQLNWVGQRERASGDTRDPLSGYASADLAVRKHFSDGLELAFVGRNLGNADIREPSRGPSPGQPFPSIQNDLPQQGRYLSVEFSAPW